MTLNPELVAILVCPKCKGELATEQGETALICHACRLRYPVREGIPVMLVAEAEQI
jgi:uncharacterized protein YbaR (Trm112 family)